MTPPGQGPSADEQNWPDCLPPVPVVGAPVPTACGGTVAYVGGMGCILLGGQSVYFCLAVCKADFDRDPRSSCLMVGPYRNYQK